MTALLPDPLLRYATVKLIFYLIKTADENQKIHFMTEILNYDILDEMSTWDDEKVRSQVQLLINLFKDITKK